MPPRKKEIDNSPVSVDYLRSVMDGVDDAIFVLDDSMKCSYCNQRIRDWLCVSEKDMPRAKQQPVTSLFGNEVSGQAFQQQYLQALRDGSGYLECLIQPEGGESRWLEIKMNQVDLDGKSWVIVVARDITERKLQLQDAEHQATHDTLTDLPTWYLLRDQIKKILGEASEAGRSLAFYVVSLDQFREISNILGPMVGDQLLQMVAERLGEGLPEDALLARHGGYEFSALIPNVDAEEAEQWARRISALMLRSYDLGQLAGVDTTGSAQDMGMDVDFSIGFALFPEHDNTVDDLMRKASVAAQIARSRNSSIAIYDRQLDRRDADRLLLAGQLRRAIAEDSLDVHFQPIIDIKTRTIQGVECQARWHHPQRGDVSPDQFVPLAEQTGLVRLLDHWVLEQALKEMQKWSSAGFDLVFSVNLSTRTVDNPQLVEAIAEAVERWGADPTRLRMEITESALMAHPEQSLEQLRRLADQGVTIALDDFGTGYSSLAYLKQLPLDCLKIDQSFVKHMKQDDSDAVIVRSTIELAHNLGLQVVAEGVEDEETWRMLVVLGCDSVQGWFVSPAISGDELEEWMRTSDWAKK